MPSERLSLALEVRLRDGLTMFDASALAKVLLGDTIFSNMMIFGAAWQRGLVPLSHAAILKAIVLNGAAADKNQRAFELGRWAALNPQEADGLLAPNVIAMPNTPDEKIAYRADHLVTYQGKGLARRYKRMVERFEDPKMRLAVAKGYHKLLAYKDEYEVARLLLQSDAKARAEFEGDLKLTYHLAPPLLSRTGADGRPVKREFGSGSMWLFRLLARLKRLRGTPLDVFGYSEERKMERALIRQYEADLDTLGHLSGDRLDAAIALAELPLQIRGFGPVKHASAAKAEKRREELLSVLRKAQDVQAAAE